MKIKHVFGNVLRIDIPLTIKIRTIEEGTPSEMEEPFYPDATKGCIVELANNYNRKIEYEATIKDNIVHIEDNGKISIGRYKITVKCYDADGNPYRYMARDIVEICDATADAGIEAGVEFNAETHTLEGAVFIAYGGCSFEQVQSDWDVTDDTLPAFIKNKPSIPTSLAELTDDATHRTVSDAEKTAWNGKQDALLFSEHGYGRGRLVTDSSGTRFEVFLVTDKGAEIEYIVQGSDGWDHAGDTVSIPTISAIESQGYLREHQDISGKEDKMAIVSPAGTAIAAVAGTYYRFATNVDTLAVTLPTMTDASKVASVVLYLTTGTAPAVTFDSSHPVVYQDGFALEASKTYEVNCLFNGAAWVLMAAEINTGS